MADTKISALPAATALIGTELVPIVQGGVTVRSTPAAFVSNGSLALSGTNLTYTGTLTGSTGIVNIGSGQVYKDAAGNLGLGVTPSAFGAGRWMQFLSTTTVGQQQNGTANLICNAYESSANSFSYIATAAAARYNVQVGGHAWFTAPSGTAGDAITFTQAMTLNASGNLGIGTSSPPARLYATAPSGFSFGAAGVTKGLRVEHNTTQTIIQGVDNTLSGSYQPIMLSGSTVSLGISGTEKVLLDASGNLGLNFPDFFCLTEWRHA